MRKELMLQLNKTFEQLAYTQNNVEYWMARDLQRLLDYTEWRNFLLVIDKAKTACINSGQNISDHFVDVNKTIPMPKGAVKDLHDIMLTRYACYLIAQNGDPRKEQIAFAQSYFAIQTRKQELLEERIALVERIRAREKLADTETELSGIVYERGVDGEGFVKFPILKAEHLGVEIVCKIEVVDKMYRKEDVKIRKCKIKTSTIPQVLPLML